MTEEKPIMEKKAKTLSEMETAEVPPEKLAPVEEPVAPPEGVPPEDLELKSKRLMLKMGFGFAGNAMETYTDDPDMNLNDEELQALIEAWEPFIPHMPAWIFAAITTSTIFGKKFVIWKRKKGKKKEEKPKAKPEVEPKKPSPPTITDHHTSAAPDLKGL